MWLELKQLEKCVEKKDTELEWKMNRYRSELKEMEWFMVSKLFEKYAGRATTLKTNITREIYDRKILRSIV